MVLVSIFVIVFMRIKTRKYEPNRTVCIFGKQLVHDNGSTLVIGLQVIQLDLSQVNTLSSSISQGRYTIAQISPVRSTWLKLAPKTTCINMPTSLNRQHIQNVVAGDRFVAALLYCWPLCLSSRPYSQALPISLWICGESDDYWHTFPINIMTLFYHNICITATS